MVFSLAWRMTGDRGLAEEIAQWMFSGTGMGIWPDQSRGSCLASVAAV